MACPTTFEIAPIARACKVAFSTSEDDILGVVVKSILGRLQEERRSE